MSCRQLDGFGRGFRHTTRNPSISVFYRLQYPMAFYRILLVVSGCLSCNVRTIPKNREKVVEDYVLSAKFDERTDIPQLTDKSQLGNLRMEGKEGSVYLHTRRIPGVVEEVDNGLNIQERDLLVHHHHIPAPAPPPPPPPPPPVPPPPVVGVANPHSLFAIGFIAFLILLNSLHTSLLLTLKSKHGLPLKPLGRRRRWIPDDQNEQKWTQVPRGCG